MATGWGSSVYAGGVRPGDAVAVVGVGGLGSAAVQGARLAGARHIFADRPGAVQADDRRAASARRTRRTDVAAAFDLIREVTWGRMCDVVVLTMGTGRARPDGRRSSPWPPSAAGRGHQHLPGRPTPSPRLALIGLAQWEKQIVGCIFGSVNSRADVPRLLSLYRDGLLDLDGMVTSTYPLEDINQGYQDMHDGKNIRGVLVM